MRLDELKAAIAAIEAEGSEAEITEAAKLLEGMRRKIGVRCQSLAEQNNSVFLASAGCDKATLRNYAEFSQHESIRSWAAEAVNARRSTPR